MSETPASKASPKIINALILLIAITPIVGVLAPRVLGFMPPIIGIISFLGFRWAQKSWPPVHKAGLISILALMSLAALSSLWSLDPDFALERSGKIASVLIGGYLLFVSLRAWPPETMRKLYSALPVALGVAGVICIFELQTQGLIYNTWRGRELNSNLSVINRAVVLLVMLMPLGFLYAWKSDRGDRLKKALIAFLALLTIVMSVLTFSQSAQVFLLLFLLCWCVFPVKRNKAWIALGVLICAAILSSPWLAQFLFNEGAAAIHKKPWLMEAFASHRLEIWDFIARKALENPLYGFGIEATRHIEEFDTQKLYTPHAHVLHPHNAVLQIWIEFGAIGAALLCALILYILRAFSLQTPAQSRFNVAMLIAVIGIASTSYGLWQGWWVGLMSLIISLCAAASDKNKAQ